MSSNNVYFCKEIRKILDLCTVKDICQSPMSSCIFSHSHTQLQSCNKINNTFLNIRFFC